MRESTRVSLSQDNNLTAEERDHSRKNWEIMLTGLKKVLEGDIIQGLFAEYESAFAALDIEKNAGFFADTFISAGPRGAIAQSKAEFLSLAHQQNSIKQLDRLLPKYCLCTRLP